MLIYGLNSNAPVGGGDSLSADGLSADILSADSRAAYKSVRKHQKSSTRVKTAKSVRGGKKKKKSSSTTVKESKSVKKGGKIKKLKKKNVNLLKRLGIRVKKQR